VSGNIFETSVFLLFLSISFLSTIFVQFVNGELSHAFAC